MVDGVQHSLIMIDLMRHGEVAGRQHVARGSTDDPLSEHGWKQMQQIKTQIGMVDEIATSPLQRCRLFGEACDEPLHILEDMREIDFGDWENRSADEVNDTERLQQFFHDPSGFQAPNGEHFMDFSHRVWMAWEQWVALDSGEHRLLLAHGCVIRVLLANMLGMPLSHVWRLSLGYASWSRISWMQGEQPRILFINREPEL